MYKETEKFFDNLVKTNIKKGFKIENKLKIFDIKKIITSDNITYENAKTSNIPASSISNYANNITYINARGRLNIKIEESMVVPVNIDECIETMENMFIDGEYDFSKFKFITNIFDINKYTDLDDFNTINIRIDIGISFKDDSKKTT